jgi:hypothetical protein
LKKELAFYFASECHFSLSQKENFFSALLSEEEDNRKISKK